MGVCAPIVTRAAVGGAGGRRDLSSRTLASPVVAALHPGESAERRPPAPPAAARLEPPAYTRSMIVAMPMP